MGRRRTGLGVVAVCAAAACGGAEAGSAPFPRGGAAGDGLAPDGVSAGGVNGAGAGSAPIAAGASGTEAERFFPLREGHIHSYRLETGEGQAGVVTIKSRRLDAQSGALQMPSGRRDFTYDADGIRLGAGGPYFLRWPLAEGQSWRGDRGATVTIAAVGATVDVPAGTYRDCVKTIERRGGDRPVQIDTTICPDVGIVILQAASGTAYERLTLQSYAPPVDLGPDGLRVLPPGG
ncbi:MAG: hypothetical protein AAGN82_16880 [Myxococcota bacterium]